MVVTKGMWNSMHIWQAKQASLWNFPLEWDPKRKKLVYYYFSKKLYIWAAVICCMAVNIFISLLLFLSHIFGYITLSFIPAILLIAINIWLVLIFLMQLVLLNIVQDPVAAYNALIRLDRGLKAGPNCIITSC